MRRIIELLLISVFVATAFCGIQTSFSAEVIKVAPKFCTDGVMNSPSKLFSIYLFCDDAEGTTIGIILDKFGTKETAGGLVSWKLHERFWQEASWARDVTNILWSDSKRFLYVATSPVYGSGIVFELDLYAKKSKQLIIPPENRDHYLQIIGIEKGQLLIGEFSFEEEKILKRISVNVTPDL